MNNPKLLLLRNVFKVLSVMFTMLLIFQINVNADQSFDKKEFLEAVGELEKEISASDEGEAMPKKQSENQSSDSSAAESSKEKSGDGRLRVGDAIIIRVYQEPDLSGNFDIASSGYVSLPLISSIKAEGLTEIELEREVTERLKKYLKDPRVTVNKNLGRMSRIETDSSSVSLYGEFKKPGQYPVGDDLTLFQALTLGGGLTRDAGDRISLIRPSNQGSSVSVFSVRELTLGRSDDPQIFPGDKIVSELTDSYLEGAAILGRVRRPGIYGAEGTMTLVRIIAQAGGLAPTADAGRIRLSRVEDDKTVIKVYDLNKILMGQAADPLVKGGDKIYVEESFF